jgi:hypothetical protein
MDLTRPNLKVDVVIGDDTGEALGDSPCLEDDVAAFHGLVGHAVNLLPAGGSAWPPRGKPPGRISTRLKREALVPWEQTPGRELTYL